MKTDYDNPTDGAVARVLARLGSLPVDTAALDRVIRREIPPPPPRRNRRWWASISAVAASLLLVAALAFGLLQGREAQASPAQMAQMHMDIVSGKIPTVQAKSIEEANRLVAAMAGGGPTIPEPPSHTMACCMQKIGDKKVACVLLDDGGTPVTMAVADASEIASPKSPVVVRDGATYHVENVGTLEMVMMQRQHRWVCLIGPTSQEKLIDLAEAIHF